ncbi:hypothetical protein MNBD_GAMMA04-263 [hydrothermal vent metagenome]|uniref:Uncharacterized protein n=1 Tax=hydrothermal vent metagenome TaxID=652676 RepID=A0A3B0WKD4_9ZZZZ
MFPIKSKVVVVVAAIVAEAENDMYLCLLPCKLMLKLTDLGNLRKQSLASLESLGV